MLSPLDLQNKKVVTKKRKYDKVEMDEYLDLIFENYKELYSQNQELQKQVKTLSDGVQYYRSIESTMQKALVLAEKTSKETKDAAILKAEAIEKDANSKAAKIVSEAEQEYETIKEKCLYLVQQFNQYKMQLKQVAAAQLELITSESFDVYSPELDALQNATNSLPVTEDISPKETASKNDTIMVTPMESEEYPDTDSSDFMEDDDIDKTTILPDIKKELVKDNRKLSEEDELSILTADTIDLSDSIQKVQKEEETDSISIPQEAQVKEVQEAQIKTPMVANPLSPLDARLQEIRPSEPEMLEPVVGEEKDAPTLDSLLQNMNFGKKKKKKKGQEEDPFEFLGSVDDF
ncbi:MAG: DivIVA domain-containing protein [Eubacterium sp.]|nr:DivIVA domain-containing protein [Eubacterium sp.]